MRTTLSKSILILVAGAVPSIGRKDAIIPRPPNAGFCVPQIYLFTSHRQADNCQLHLPFIGQVHLFRSQSTMVLSKSLSAYALYMRLLYIGAALMCNLIAALSGIGEFDLKIGFMTYF